MRHAPELSFGNIVCADAAPENPPENPPEDPTREPTEIERGGQCGKYRHTPVINS
jgi:hypothetical protein